MKGVLILKILYLLLFVFALLISGCDDGDNKASAPANNKPTDTATASTQQSSTQQKSNSEIENKMKNLRFGVVEGKEYHLVKLGNTNIFVTPISITTTKKLSHKTTMGQFLVIELYVLNDSREPITFTKSDFSLWEIEKKGNQIARTFELDYDVIASANFVKGKRQSAMDGKINPGLENIIFIPFEIPNNFDYANNGKLVVKFKYQDKPVVIGLKVRTKDFVRRDLEERAKAKQ